MKKLSETYREQGIDFTFPIEIKDANGESTYYEDSDGDWYRSEHDDNSNLIYCENSTGFWCKYDYDDNGNCTYAETSLD